MFWPYNNINSSITRPANAMQSPFISVDASLQVNNPEPTCQPQTGHSIWITHSTHTIPLTSPISYIYYMTFYAYMPPTHPSLSTTTYIIALSNSSKCNATRIQLSITTILPVLCHHHHHTYNNLYIHRVRFCQTPKPKSANVFTLCTCCAALLCSHEVAGGICKTILLAIIIRRAYSRC